MTILQTIQKAGQIAGSLVETFLLANPQASEADAVAFVQRNVDLLVNHLVTSPFLQAAADGIANEIIAYDVPQLYEKELQKLGGIPVAPAAAAAAAAA